MSKSPWHIVNRKEKNEGILKVLWTKKEVNMNKKWTKPYRILPNLSFLDKNHRKSIVIMDNVIYNDLADTEKGDILFYISRNYSLH